MKQAKVRGRLDGRKVGGLKVHVQPSKNSRVLDAFAPGQKVDMTERRELGWAEVWCSTPRDEHVLGWVPERFLEIECPAPSRTCGAPLKAPPVLIPAPDGRLFRSKGDFLVAALVAAPVVLIVIMAAGKLLKWIYGL